MAYYLGKAFITPSDTMSESDLPGGGRMSKEKRQGKGFPGRCVCSPRVVDVGSGLSPTSLGKQELDREARAPSLEVRCWLDAGKKSIVPATWGVSSCERWSPSCLPCSCLVVYLQSTVQPALESDHPHLSKPRWSGIVAERWWWLSAQLNTWNSCFTPSWTHRACASSAKPVTASCPGAQVVLQWGDHGHWDWPPASPWSSQCQINPPVHICFQIKKGLKTWKKPCSCSVCRLSFVHSSSPFQHYFLSLPLGPVLPLYPLPTILPAKEKQSFFFSCSSLCCAETSLQNHLLSQQSWAFLWLVDAARRRRRWRSGGGNGRKYCREIMRERVLEEMMQLVLPVPHGCLCWVVFRELVFLIFIFSYCI